VGRRSFEVALYSTRFLLCKVNEQMRDPKHDVGKLHELYKNACSRFFHKEYQTFQESYPLINFNDIHSLLVCKFYDISFVSNQTPPVALPVTFDACNQARALLKRIQWFKLPGKSTSNAN
jgi:hypothetical protein